MYFYVVSRAMIPVVLNGLVHARYFNFPLFELESVL